MPAPVAEVPLPPARASHGPPDEAPGTAGPLTGPPESRPVQHDVAKPAVADMQSLVAHMTADDSAARAAEDAREAYIRASIAAGINPLPLG